MEEKKEDIRLPPISSEGGYQNYSVPNPALNQQMFPPQYRYPSFGPPPHPHYSYPPMPQQPPTNNWGPLPNIGGNDVRHTTETDSTVSKRHKSKHRKKRRNKRKHRHNKHKKKGKRKQHDQFPMVTMMPFPIQMPMNGYQSFNNVVYSTTESSSDDYSINESDTAARLIQQWWRGTTQRKKAINTLFFMDSTTRKLIQTREFSNVILDDLIEEFITSDFIPDLLIDILSKSGDEFTETDEAKKLAWSFYDEIEKEVCYDLSRIILQSAIDSVVQQYLRTQSQSELGGSILNRMSDDLMREVLDSETRLIVKDAISEVAHIYLIEEKARQCFYGILGDITQQWAMQSFDNRILMDIIDSLISEVVCDTIVPKCALQTYQSEIESYESGKKQRELDTIQTKLQSYLLDNELMNRFLTALSTRNEESSIRSAIEMLLDIEISHVLIDKHLQISAHRQRTDDNIVLRSVLKNMIAGVSIPHFIRMAQNFPKNQP